MASAYLRIVLARAYVREAQRMLDAPQDGWQTSRQDTEAYLIRAIRMYEAARAGMPAVVFSEQLASVIPSYNEKLSADGDP